MKSYPQKLLTINITSYILFKRREAERKNKREIDWENDSGKCINNKHNNNNILQINDKENTINTQLKNNSKINLSMSMLYLCCMF